MTPAEVEQALLALDRDDRAEVLRRGIRSLDMDDAVDEEQAGVDAAWRAELRRRIDGIESGKVDLLDADESHAQLRAELAARRKRDWSRANTPRPSPNSARPPSGATTPPSR